MSKAMTQDELNAALIAAAKDGNVKEAGVLIGNGARVDAADDIGMQALHWAVREGHMPVVELLLARGAQVEAATEYGTRPLHIAAANCHKDMAEFLVAKGASVDAACNAGNRPLHYVALNAGAPSRVHRGILNGLWIMTKFLLEHGANPAPVNNNGEKPWNLCKYERIIHLLLEAEREWDPASGEREALAVLRGRLRKLGSLRPKGPAL